MAALGLEADSDCARPTVALAARQVRRVVDMPVDGRLAAMAHQLGLEDHW